MSLHIFSKNNQANLSQLQQSLKAEQIEVSSLFDLSHEEMDFEIILLLAATRALRSSLILRHYGELFFIKSPIFDACLSTIVMSHGNFLEEAESLSAARYLEVVSHFKAFSEQIQKCIFIIEEIFEGKLDMSPKNNLMMRYLHNLKNSISHLRDMALLASLHPDFNLKNNI